MEPTFPVVALLGRHPLGVMAECCPFLSQELRFILYTALGLSFMPEEFEEENSQRVCHHGDRGIPWIGTSAGCAFN